MTLEYIHIEALWQFYLLGELKCKCLKIQMRLVEPFLQPELATAVVLRHGLCRKLKKFTFLPRILRIRDAPKQFRLLGRVQ